MYRIYLKQGEKQFLFPVTPAKIETKAESGNQTVSILEMGQMNLLRYPKLRQVRFTALFPGRQYHFVQVEDGFHEPSYYLGLLEEFQRSKKPVQFLVLRRLADGSQIFCDDLSMAIEDVQITEKGGEQGDFWAEILLREYKEAKSVKYQAAAEGDKTILSASGIQREEKETPKTYTVQKGDSLWAIAQKNYGSGAKYKEIAEKNGISNPNLIYPGQVLQL